MQFGMPTLIENKTLKENIDLCRSLGFDFLELNMNFPEYQIDVLEDTEALIRAAEGKTPDGAEKGIYYTIHLDENLDPAEFNPIVREAWLQTVRRTIGAAKKLIPLKDRYGDPAQPVILNMHMCHGIHMTLPDKKVQMYERNFEFYKRCFRTFKTLCEKWIDGADIVIAIENTDGFTAYEKAVIAMLLESSVFGLTWDIGHSETADSMDVPFIREYMKSLCHMHVHDGSANPPRDHQTLGSGGIDVKARLFDAASCRARCLIETKTVQALKSSKEWLIRNGYCE